MILGYLFTLINLPLIISRQLRFGSLNGRNFRNGKVNLFTGLQQEFFWLSLTVMLNGHPYSEVMLSKIIPPSKNTSRFSYCNGRNVTTSKGKRIQLSVDVTGTSFITGPTDSAFVGATHLSILTYIKCSNTFHNYVHIKTQVLKCCKTYLTFKFSICSFLNEWVVKIVYPL